MKKPSSKDRAAGPGTNRGASLWAYSGYVAAAGLLAIALMAALVFASLLPAAKDALETQARETHGRTYAALFDGRIMELRRWLAAAAAAPSVREALASRDDARLRAAGELIDSVFDFAERVDVYLPGTATLDPDATVPVSYAALDVIKRAQAGAFVGPEAIATGHMAIYAAQPVESDGEVIGIVFVAIEPGYFQAPLANFDTGAGEVTLQQSFDTTGTEAIDILKWGEADPAAAPQRLELSAPHWILVFRPGRHALPDSLDNTSVLIASLVAIGIFAIGLVVTFLRLGGALRHDTDRLRNTLRGVASPIENAGGYRLAPIAGLAVQLKDLIAQRPAGDGESTVTTGAPGAPVDALLPAGQRSAPQGQPPTEEFLEIAGPAETSDPERSNAGPAPVSGIDAAIFRADDIFGVAGNNLTEEAVYRIGRAFAAEALEQNLQRVAVGHDGRRSSKPLRGALVRGLTEGGADVVDIGEVPTPVLYFATLTLDAGGAIMVTGSHHPPEYNGLQMMLGGANLTGEQIQALLQRIAQGRLSEGAGAVEVVDLRETYIDRILSDVVVAQRLKVVVDCGNGVAGDVAPDLISRLDCEVVPLYCDVDGEFPNHRPDPADPRNLEDLMTVVKAEGADLGLAFDGDGDRLGVVTSSGRIVWPDKLLMLFAQDVVGRNPGADIVYDVRCSSHLNGVISELGGRPIMWKTGHSHIKAKLRDTGALLAGEFSGHICFGERWYGFDDALYAAARLLEILGGAHESADALFARFPRTSSSPELRIQTTEESKSTVIARLAEEGDFGAGTVTTIDGVRVDFEDGWGLIQPSVNEPLLTLRFEADTEDALERIQAIFAAQLNRIAPDLKFRQAR